MDLNHAPQRHFASPFHRHGARGRDVMLCGRPWVGVGLRVWRVFISDASGDVVLVFEDARIVDARSN